jgi:hypothetical protein
METQPQSPGTPGPEKPKARELVKPRRLREAYADAPAADPLCAEYSCPSYSPSSCSGNVSVGADEDTILF